MEETQTPMVSAEALKILLNIRGTKLEVDILLRRKLFSVGELFTLSPGSVLLLDAAPNDPAILRINKRDFASGRIASIGERYGIIISDMIDQQESDEVLDVSGAASL